MELPLISTLLADNAIVFSQFVNKIEGPPTSLKQEVNDNYIQHSINDATEFSSEILSREQNGFTKLRLGIKRLKQVISGNNCHLAPRNGKQGESDPKYYINNPPKLIKNTESSGGVEAPFLKRSHTVRLSISPSQGDDPGFKSRPEHFYSKFHR